MMDLQLLVSKKGTKVVTATNLHQVLELGSQNYAQNIRKWLDDVFEFRDGIRKPVKMQDYAPRRMADSTIIEDYYLSVELAKLIALHSKSKLKLKYAKWLQSQEEQPADPEMLSKEQVLVVLDLVKEMGRISYQENCERSHHKVYESLNGGQAHNWWNYRADILGYSAEVLREKVRAIGQKSQGKSQRQLLMFFDKYEVIRTGVIDLFMALGKSEQYARSMGDLAKSFAEELQIEIFDDRGDQVSAARPITAQLIHAVAQAEAPGASGGR